MGNHKNDNRSWYHFTFPIAFSMVLTIAGGYSTRATEAFYGYTNNIVNNSFDMYIDGLETGRYIALGI